MRAVGLHADVVVATSRAYQTTCTLVRSAGEAFCIDSPVFPDELEILPALAEQAGFAVVGLLATHARLGPPARPLRVPRGAARRARRRPRRGWSTSPATPSARCASSTKSSTSSARGRCRFRARSGCRCPGSVEVGDRELELQPGRRAHRGRHGDLDPVGAACSSAATTCRRSRSRCCRHGLGERVPGDAEPARAAGRAGRPRRARPRRRRSTACARPRSCARTARTWRRCCEHGEAAKLPLARRTRAQKRRSTPRTSQRVGVSLHDRDPRLEAAVLAAARARLAADPPPLGCDAAEPAALRPRSRAGGLGAERGAGAAARRAAAVGDPDRPSALLRVHPRRAGAGGRARRRAARGQLDLRRLVARGRRRWSTPRTRRCAWLAALAGFPETAGGCFVQGGTNGNLSALHAARERRGAAGGARRGCVQRRGALVGAVDARMMDAEVLDVPGERLDRRRAGGGARRGGDGVFAVVATAGTTNLGLIDDLAGVAAVCGERGHLAARRRRLRPRRPVRAERARALRRDRARRLVHRRPAQVAVLAVRLLRAASTATRRSARPRTASTRPTWRRCTPTTTAFNPSDYGVHLTRRARGLPFWFSLAVHGTDAFTRGGRATLARHAREAAAEIRARAELELLRRARADRARVPAPRLGARPTTTAGPRSCARPARAFVMPTTVGGETVARLAIVNPRTTLDDLRLVLDPMRVIRPGGLTAPGVTWFARYQVSPDLGDSPHMTPAARQTRCAPPPSARCWRRSATSMRVSASWSGRASTLCPGKTRPRPVR